MKNNLSILERNHTDCVRGISALLIAIFHVLLECENMPRYINLTGSVCVAAYLFLSGYGIHESYKKIGLKKYWYKRFKRVILPYTIFITILIPFKPNNTFTSYALDITYIHSTYWFIEFIVWNYLVYWIAQRFFAKHLFTIFILVGIIGINTLMQMEAEQVFSFLAGVFVSKHVDKVRLYNEKELIVIAIICFLFGTFFLLLKEIPAIHAYKGTTTYNYILLMIKLPMAVPLVLFPVIFPIVTKSKILYLCGISSLEIYLVHLALLNYLTIDYLHLFIYILSCVILTYLFYQLNRLISKWI